MNQENMSHTIPLYGFALDEYELAAVVAALEQVVQAWDGKPTVAWVNLFSAIGKMNQAYKP